MYNLNEKKSHAKLKDKQQTRKTFLNWGTITTLYKNIKQMFIKCFC